MNYYLCKCGNGIKSKSKGGKQVNQSTRGKKNLRTHVQSEIHLITAMGSITPPSCPFHLSVFLILINLHSPSTILGRPVNLLIYAVT